MIRAKNYEIMSTFVEVMQTKLWSLFSGYGVQVSKQVEQRKQPSVSHSIIHSGRVQTLSPLTIMTFSVIELFFTLRST